MKKILVFVVPIMLAACGNHTNNASNADSYTPVDSTPRVTQTPDTYNTKREDYTNSTDNSSPNQGDSGGKNLRPGSRAHYSPDSMSQKDIENNDLTNRKYPRK